MVSRAAPGPGGSQTVTDGPGTSGYQWHTQASRTRRLTGRLGRRTAAVRPLAASESESVTVTVKAVRLSRLSGLGGVTVARNG